MMKRLLPVVASREPRPSEWRSWRAKRTPPRQCRTLSAEPTAPRSSQSSSRSFLLPRLMPALLSQQYNQQFNSSSHLQERERESERQSERQRERGHLAKATANTNGPTDHSLLLDVQSVDYVVNLLPSTAETRGMLAGSALLNCQGAVLINVVRGPASMAPRPFFGRCPLVIIIIIISLHHHHHHHHRRLSRRLHHQIIIDIAVNSSSTSFLSSLSFSSRQSQA